VGCGLDLEISVGGKGALLAALGGNAGFLVLTHSFFEEIGFAFHGNKLHKVKRVGRVVNLGQTQDAQQMVGYVFNVLAHEVGVHADQPDGQGIGDKFFINFDGVGDDLVNLGRIELAGEMAGVQQGRKVPVQALITANQFVGECQTGHESPLLEPENTAKRTGEENALDRRKGNESLGKRALADPTQRPIGFFANAIHVIDGVEKVVLFGGVLDVGIDQQRIGLGMDVLHHNLKTVEAAGFGVLDLVQEIDGQVFVDNSVTGRKEGQHVFDEMLLVGVELVFPVGQILGEVNFFGCPKTGFRLFVKIPDIAVLDWKKDKAVFILDENGFSHG